MFGKFIDVFRLRPEKFPKSIRQRPCVVLFLGLLVVLCSILVIRDWLLTFDGLLSLFTGIFGFVMGISELVAWSALLRTPND